MPANQMERRNRPPYSEFAKRYLYPRKPVVITGALDRWKARSRWPPEFFKQRYGEVPLLAEGQPYTLGGFLPHKDDRRPFTMGALIDLVLASTEEETAPYLRSVHIA